MSGKIKAQPKLGPLLFETLSIQSKSGPETSKGMEEYILNTLDGFNIEGLVVHVDKRNIYVTKGETALYPAIVAHTDTVHTPVQDFVVQRIHHLYAGFDLSTGKQAGVGGDDKVGVAIALACVRDMAAVKAVFFRDEEIGCLGAKEADLAFFEDVSFVMEADRRGMADVVTAINGEKLVSRDFCLAAAPLLEEFGRQWSTEGMSTDVGTLKDIGLDLCVTNISCGYFNPHTAWETVNPHYANASYAFIRAMFADLGDKRWEFVRPVKSRTSIIAGGTGYRRPVTWWPDEEYFEELDFMDERSLEDAWLLRAHARADSIRERKVTPYENNPQGGLFHVESDPIVPTRKLSKWVLSRGDDHPVKNVPNPEDLASVQCPACQYAGSLRVDLDDVLATAQVICLFCLNDDLVTIGSQQFVGDFIDKERNKLTDETTLRGHLQGLGVLLEDDDYGTNPLVREYIGAANNPQHYLEARVHQGWNQHSLDGWAEYDDDDLLQ